MLNIGLLIASKRANRFADKPVQWIVEGALLRSGIKIAVIDSFEARLPFYSEPMGHAYTGSLHPESRTEARCHSIGKFDAFVAVAPEYNHGPTAVLKNRIDNALLDWQRKPIAFVGYGGVGTAHAIEAMRSVAIGLQMAPIHPEVNIAWEPFSAVFHRGKSLDDFPHLVRSRDRMFDRLVWWAEALKAARQGANGEHREVA